MTTPSFVYRFNSDRLPSALCGRSVQAQVSIEGTRQIARFTTAVRPVDAGAKSFRPATPAVKAGDYATYLLDVLGMTWFQGAEFTIPASSSFVDPLNAYSGGGQQQYYLVCSSSTPVVKCTVAFSMVCDPSLTLYYNPSVCAGLPEAIAIRFKVGEQAVAGTALTSTAKLRFNLPSTCPDPNPANDSASATASVSP